MKKINVKIYWDGVYGAVCEEIDGCIATNATLIGVKEGYTSALELHFDGMREDGEEVPFKYTLEFELTTRAILRSVHEKTTLKALQEATGINARQLSHYSTGKKNPRPEQRRRIIEGLHKIGKELVSVI
jgi:Uncharacterized conserved protein